jgi:basic membrane protein A
MKWLLKLLLLVLIALSSSALADQPLRVALIVAQGGLGDLSYNDLAYSGLQQAVRDFAGQIEVRAVQSPDIAAQAESVLRSAARAGFDLIISLEYASADALGRLAGDYPDTQFAILNIVVDGPNITSVMFGEHEGSFLAGALAALVTSDPSVPNVNPDRKIIGAIGGTKSLGIDKFIVGFAEGARYVDPDVQVLVSYSETFGDPATGRRLATAMFERGADVVYQIAGGTGQGVIDAARDAGRYALGVDTDQDYLAPGHVLTSMIKRADLAVYRLIEMALDGELSGGEVLTFGLAEDGVGISPMQYTRDQIPGAILQRIEEIREEILAGTITPTDITAVDNPRDVMARLGLGE